MRRRLGTIVSLICILFSGCVSGPSTEKKSALNCLNREHYQGTHMVSGIQTQFERQVVSTKIEGVSQIVSDLVPMPLKFQRVQLMQRGKVVLEVVTDALGTFVFSGEIPNGPYNIHVASERYVGDVVVDVNGYELKNLLLETRVKP